MTSSDKSQSLPIIDITSYLDDHDPHDRLSTSSAIHSACLKYGFFYLRINSIADPSEPEDLTKLAREFFALPEAEKAKLAVKNEDGARGYAHLTENVYNGRTEHHEAVDFFRPVDNPDKTRSLWGENQWPTVPSFKEKYEAWVEKMTALGLLVMEAMADGLGMTPEEWQGLRGQVDKSFWVMRVIGYPPLPIDHNGVSCEAHKDYGCLTFLHADPTRSALQVLVKNASGADQAVDNLPAEVGAEEGTWINADPVEGCILVNIGDMWEIWTNGLYKSTLHQVIHRGSNYRVSIPFFFSPNFDANIEVLAAARRLQSGQTKGDGSGKEYDSVVYGSSLVEKMGGHFAEPDNKGKSD